MARGEKTLKKGKNANLVYDRVVWRENKRSS